MTDHETAVRTAAAAFFAAVDAARAAGYRVQFTPDNPASIAISETGRVVRPAPVAEEKAKAPPVTFGTPKKSKD